MSLLQDAQGRIAAVLDEIERLRQSEFPYTHPSDALSLLESIFRARQAVLEKASPDLKEATLHNVCSQSLRESHVYVPILGFLLRATNVRNGFEAHGPLQRLAKKLMGTNTKLILSSEWEFSPFVYRAITGLRGFVLIGLPAPESSNPLLLPLAGHELGHAVWEHERMALKYDRKIWDGVLDALLENRWDAYAHLHLHTKEDVERSRSPDVFVGLTWRPAYTWALLQIEEMFSDFLGLRLFGESFLYAFAYLLSPGVSGQRSVGYPEIKRRVSHIVQAAKMMGVEVPVDYASTFDGETEPTDPTTSLLVGLADEVSASLEQELIQLAMELADTKQIPKKTKNTVEAIATAFRKWVVPARMSASLVDVLNAGWECNRDENLWNDIPQITGNKTEDFEKNRNRVLRDIMFKSMEVAEIHERLGGAS